MKEFFQVVLVPKFKVDHVPTHQSQSVFLGKMHSPTLRAPNQSSQAFFSKNGSSLFGDVQGFFLLFAVGQSTVRLLALPNRLYTVS